MEQVQIIERLCPCCGVDPEVTPLSLCCDNMELAELGAGYVMYFKITILFGIIWLVFAFINIWKVIANFKGTQCYTDSYINDVRNAVEAARISYDKVQFENSLCRKDWITAPSRANYGINKEDTNEATWLIVFFIAYQFALALIKSYIKKTNAEIDKRSDLPSDWTLIVDLIVK
jgi:hypothetical protein